MRNTLTAGFFTLLATALCGAELTSPYGVCAHLNRWEYDTMAQELKLMSGAGIRQVRTDLDWAQVEKTKGEWNFERWDALIQKAGENGITVLPILAGNQPRRSSPLVKHMNEWKNYLKTVLIRYGKRLPCWEVVNEPDLNEFSNPETYGNFLNETYRKIKRINPKATVLTGGFGNIPLNYLERMFKTGANRSFDVMNIHPYYWQDYPENSLAAELRGLKKLMQKYQAGDKKIWMTETGYSTAKHMDLKPLTTEVLKKLNLNANNVPIVLIRDPDYRYDSEGLILERGTFFPSERKFKEITLKKIASLDVKTYPLLLLAANESFPMAFADALHSYVKQGGTIFIPGGGVPFYYNVVKKPDGSILREPAPESIQKKFHLGWDAWWMVPKAPKGTGIQEAAPWLPRNVGLPGSATRFLSAKNLKQGDELIPIVTAFSKDRGYSAPSAGIYKLNSDLKGNIIVFTWSEYTHSIKEETQANLLPRTYLIALSAGVDKVFWYSFRSMRIDGNEREGHFGIINRDLSPKPAYFAYQTLTAMCPSGSTRPTIEEKLGVFLCKWRKPDGTHAAAVWTPVQTRRIKLDIKGKAEFFDRSGKKITIDPNRFTAGPEIVYIVGEKNLKLPRISNSPNSKIKK